MSDVSNQGGALSSASDPSGSYGAVAPILSAAGMSPGQFYNPAMIAQNGPLDDQSANQSNKTTQGILQQFGNLQQQRDQYGQQKMQAIQRAMDYLDKTKAGQNVNLPMLAAAGGMLKPAWSIGQAVGNSVDAAVPAIEQQRQHDLSFAQGMGNMGVAQSQVPLDINQQDESSLEKQLRTQQYEDMVNARKYAADQAAGSRTDVAQINAGSRVDVAALNGQNRQLVAQLNASKSNLKYSSGFQTDDFGNQVPGMFVTDATGNQPMQFIPNVQFSGPNGAGGKPSVFQQKQQAWLAAHPNDMAGALDFAGGHRAMSDQEMVRSAYASAHSQFPPPKDLDAAAQHIYQQMKTVFGTTGTDAPAPDATGPATTAKPVAPPKPVAKPATPAPGAGGASPTPAAQQQGGGLKAPDQATLAGARNAIQRGADPAAVAKRLQDNGFDPSGL